MNESEILNWLSSNIIQIIIILSIFIQISPIKWNPLTSLFNWLGKLMTKDVSKQVEDYNSARNIQIEEIKTEMTNKVKEFTDAITKIQHDVDTNEKDRIRYEVLSFARSCRNSTITHTYDEFKHILKLNDKYQDLLVKTKDKNGVFDSEIKYINDKFDEYKKQNNIKEE